MMRAWLWAGTLAGGLIMASAGLILGMFILSLQEGAGPESMAEIGQLMGRPAIVLVGTAIWVAGMWWNFRRGRRGLAAAMSALPVVVLALLFLFIGPGALGPNNFIPAGTAR